MSDFIDGTFNGIPKLISYRPLRIIIVINKSSDLDTMFFDKVFVKNEFSCGEERFFPE